MEYGIEYGMNIKWNKDGMLNFVQIMSWNNFVFIFVVSRWCGGTIAFLWVGS